jgi:WD40 repeat protein
MNLWRVSVDTSTGGRLGDFEPLTAGVGASARHLSVAAAGRRIAYASQTEQGGIYRVEFNPNSGTIEGEPTPVTHLTASMGYAKVSPDGEWIACSSFVHQEDLVLLRVGGTERRQLTNDPARDRGPRWSPDGISLIFYSDRGGKYEVWSIRPDGSELRRIGEYPGASVTQPLFSPDGSRIAAYTDSGLLMFDTVPSIGQKAPELIGWHDGLRRMSPRSWSADGQIIACSVHIPGPSKGIGFYYLDQREFEHAIDGTDEAVWLKDSRRLIFTRDHGIYLYDVQSKKEKLLLDVAPAKVGHYCLSLAPEDKAIFFYQSRIESDIWLIDWE